MSLEKSQTLKSNAVNCIFSPMEAFSWDWVGVSQSKTWACQMKTSQSFLTNGETGILTGAICHGHRPGHNSCLVCILYFTCHTSLPYTWHCTSQAFHPFLPLPPLSHLLPSENKTFTWDYRSQYQCFLGDAYLSTCSQNKVQRALQVHGRGEVECNSQLELSIARRDSLMRGVWKSPVCFRASMVWLLKWRDLGGVRDSGKECQSHSYSKSLISLYVWNEETTWEKN